MQNAYMYVNGKESKWRKKLKWESNCNSSLKGDIRGLFNMKCVL